MQLLSFDLVSFIWMQLAFICFNKLSLIAIGFHLIQKVLFESISFFW